MGSKIMNFYIFAFLGAICMTIFGYDFALADSTTEINDIAKNIVTTSERLPGLVTGFAYVMGILFGVTGVLKLREHVENPEQTPLREGFIRLLVGGALFSLPTVYEAVDAAIRGGGLGIMGNITSILNGVNFIYSSETRSVECLSIPLVSGLFGKSSLGNAMCNMITATAALPAFFTSMSYLFGLIFGFWGILKVKDHVLDPRQTPVWDAITRLLAAGAFFALPIVVEAVRMTVTPGNLIAVSTYATNTGFNDAAGGAIASDPTGLSGTLLGSLFGMTGGGDCGPAGLDMALHCFMSDIMGPLHVLLNFFGFVAGMVFIMIGISRIMKSTQEGAKGPLGFGTLMTFVVGGLLLSTNAILRGVSTSLFGAGVSKTYGIITYSEGFTDAAVLGHANLVVASIIKFMILVGLISFVRGLFILRGVAEGNQQASMMAGMTHIIGGALAVNLGSVINAVQGTLGISGLGIMFV